MIGKTVLITGATGGIGRATALALAAKGARLILTARNPQKGQSVLEEVRRAAGMDMPQTAEPERLQAANREPVLLLADLSLLDQVRQLAEAVTALAPRLDVLINNAGVWPARRIQTPDGLETQFAVNYLAGFLLTRLLQKPLAQAQGRVISVSSSFHYFGRIHFDDLQLTRGYTYSKAYSQSKLAQVMFTRQLAKRWGGLGITAHSLHPGVVKTGLFDGLPWMYRLFRPFYLSPAKGAATSVYLASSQDEVLSGKGSGGFFIRQKTAGPSKAALNDAHGEQLWRVSSQLCGLDETGE
ncbi:MAG: SDR family NAD(P)-dependent oxidoreductase [Deltaproteobacteria bacterium]|nr:SDR family NAD(P)-dependent oxidoreductase [Deltaproteobacteria bacterium]